MGAGKTTVGRILAQALNWRFVDLDDYVARQHSRSVSEIFQESGESAYRKLEQAALAEMLRTLPIEKFVLALGGGAILQEKIARMLRELPLTMVFLDAPADVLYQRCLSEGIARPLLRDLGQFRQLYDQRRSTYVKAGMRVDTEGALPSEVAARIARLMNRRDISL